MKKILLFLLLFINLHVVIQEAGIKIDMTATANAQRLIREVSAGLFECEDIETYERYYSSLSTCDAEAGDPDKFKCSWCGTEFYTEKKRAEHEETCEKRLDEKFNCQYCGVEFSTYEDKSDHENSCGPCKCDYGDCGMRFRTDAELTEHMKTHEGSDSGGSAGGGTGGGPTGGGIGGGGGGSAGGGGTTKVLPEVFVTAKGINQRGSYFIQPNWCTCVPSALGNALLLKYPSLTMEQIADSVARWRRIHDVWVNKDRPIDSYGVNARLIKRFYQKCGYNCRIVDISHLKSSMDEGHLVIGILRVWDVESSEYIAHAVTIYSVGMTLGTETFYSVVNPWTGTEELYNKGELYPFAFEVY